jgi:Stage II sporulation protein E (SpoIIE)
MNRLLQRSTDDRCFATFFLAEFEKATRGLTYVNAGHNPAMLLRSVWFAQNGYSAYMTRVRYRFVPYLW